MYHPGFLYQLTPKARGNDKQTPFSVIPPSPFVQGEGCFSAQVDIPSPCLPPAASLPADPISG
jgi:hypothetical protein